MRDVEIAADDDGLFPVERGDKGAEVVLPFHAAAQQPSEGEQLLADLDALSAPAAPVRQAAAPPETPQAPWRTRPRRPEPEPAKAPEPEKPDEEPEEEAEEPRPPRPKIPYDLANIPYEDAGEAADQMQSRLASLSSRMLLMTPQSDGLQMVEAEVPMSEVSDYAITLRSMTQGRGTFNVKFTRYEETPPAVQEKIIAEHKVEVEEE